MVSTTHPHYSNFINIMPWCNYNQNKFLREQCKACSKFSTTKVLLFGCCIVVAWPVQLWEQFERGKIVQTFINMQFTTLSKNISSIFFTRNVTLYGLSYLPALLSNIARRTSFPALMLQLLKRSKRKTLEQTVLSRLL